MDLPDLSARAAPGTELAVRVTPSARRNAVEDGPDGLRVWVTVAPEKGKATAAVVRLLAKALGVPKSQLTLVRGETARDKLFRIEP
jgi:hypothetical protein